MLSSFFNSIFEIYTSENSLPLAGFLICVGVSIVIGLAFALAHTIRTYYTKSFFVTLLILPAVVCVIIMVVNGNLGAGIAVAGAFSLVRFRSAQGTAKEISSLFCTMCAGLLTGMGYIGYAIVFTAVITSVSVILSLIDFGSASKKRIKTLKVTIPENLDYASVFDDIFEKYTLKAELNSVKTTNFGSMFRLSYTVILKNSDEEKQMIDEIRMRNGNLEVMISNQVQPNLEL